MNRNLKYFSLLLILIIFLYVAGFFIRSLFDPGFSSGELFSLTLAFTLISAAVLLIFFRGERKDEKEKTMTTFVAVSVKFLAELVLALVLFAIAKKTSITYVLLFFVLYLSFSLFSIGVILNALKKKTL